MKKRVGMSESCPSSHLIEAQRFGRSGSWEWNLQTKELLCTEGLLALFEISAEGFAQRGVADFFAKVVTGDRAKVRKTFWRILHDHAPICQEFRIRRSDGAIQVLLWRGTILIDQKNRPLKFIGTVFDVTKLQETSDMYREEAVRLREFMQAMPDMGFIIDEMGKIVEFVGNHVFFGNDETQHLSGKNLSDFMPSVAARKMHENVRYVLDYQTLQFGEFELHTQQGRRIFRFRFAPMTYCCGEKRTVACMASDITEQSRTKKFLQLSYEKRRQQELLNGLVEGKLQPSQTLLDQAWQVKLNLAQSFVCQALLVEQWEDKPISYWQEHRTDFQYLLDSLVEVLERDLDASVWEAKDGIGLLLPVKANCQNSKQQSIDFAESVYQVVKSHFPTAQVSIGLAEFFEDSFSSISAAYSQACDAAYLGDLVEPETAIHHYLDLGVLQILPSLSEEERVKAFIWRNIGKLLEYDKKKGSQFLDTLEKILQNENLKIVAEQSFVHHQTIIFRKKRIEEILGVSLESFETRITLAMALKLFQVAVRRNCWTLDEP
ncbi:MAG: PAS domain S-box protein [Sporomusaceae bacterium]|nr:PAS domain S-box protein [Sporomusaceae bacterium]